MLLLYYIQPLLKVTLMKILLISDTHKVISRAAAAITREKPEMVIHLGDHLKDGEELKAKFTQIPFYCLRGNCDMAGIGREELLVDLCGHRIFAAHGHRQNVKRDLYGIYFAALDNEADVSLFGHTHFPTVQDKDGILLVNPGTASGFTPTAAILTLSEGDTPTAQIIRI